MLEIRGMSPRPMSDPLSSLGRVLNLGFSRKLSPTEKRGEEN